jgi:hypothetical protein
MVMFAVVSELLEPSRFAGLFGAAPAVATVVAWIGR